MAQLPTVKMVNGKVVQMAADEIAQRNADIAVAQAAQALAQNKAAYDAAVSAGLAVSCAPGATVCASAVVGTYGIDAASQAKAQAVETAIQANHLPGGGTSFKYPDASGAMHDFTGPQFTALYFAGLDYVNALDLTFATLQAGGSATWPGNQVQLP